MTLLVSVSIAVTRVAVLEADIDPRAVTRWPETVRQCAHRNGCDLREVVGAEDFHLVQAANRHVSEVAVRVVDDVDVVGDRAGVEDLQRVEWRVGVEDLRLAGVLQGEPDLLAVRRRRDIRAEGACLLAPSPTIL